MKAYQRMKYEKVEKPGRRADTGKNDTEYEKVEKLGRNRDTGNTNISATGKAGNHI